jgi:hypothetical protein
MGGRYRCANTSPTLIVHLCIYTEHVLVVGHNGVRTAAWCSYRCETGVASRRARTAWLWRTRLSITSSKRRCKTDDTAVQRPCQAPNWSGQWRPGRSKLTAMGEFPHHPPRRLLLRCWSVWGRGRDDWNAWFG